MALSVIKTNSIAADAITAAKIAAGTIVASDLAANSVDSSELVNGSVDLVHMSADSVDSDQYVDGSIDTIHIANTSVENAMLADNAVDGTHIALGSDAQGDVMYYNGTDYVRLAPGTSGQFLKTLGAAANPAWGTVVTDTSGAWTSGTATTGKALVMGF